MSNPPPPTHLPPPPDPSEALTPQNSSANNVQKSATQTSTASATKPLGSDSMKSVTASQRGNSMISISNLSPGAMNRSGWVFKRGGGTSCLGRRTWQRRWFVLSGNLLQYHASPAHTKVLGTAEISTDSTFELESSAGTAFIVYTRLRTYHCRCDTTDECRAWITALKICRATLQQSTSNLRKLATVPKTKNLEAKFDSIFSDAANNTGADADASTDEDALPPRTASLASDPRLADQSPATMSELKLIKDRSLKANSYKVQGQGANASVGSARPAAPPRTASMIAWADPESSPDDDSSQRLEQQVSSAQDGSVPKAFLSSATPRSSKFSLVPPPSVTDKPANPPPPRHIFDLESMTAASPSQANPVAPPDQGQQGKVSPSPLRGRVFKTVTMLRAAGEPLGLGIVLGNLVGDSSHSMHIFVDFVVPGSKAEACQEFAKGDIILFINGVTMTGKSSEQVLAILAQATGEIKFGLSKRRTQKLILGQATPQKSSSTDTHSVQNSRHNSVGSSANTESRQGSVVASIPTTMTKPVVGRPLATLDQVVMNTSVESLDAKLKANAAAKSPRTSATSTANNSVNSIDSVQRQSSIRGRSQSIDAKPTPTATSTPLVASSEISKSATSIPSTIPPAVSMHVIQHEATRDNTPGTPTLMEGSSPISSSATNLHDASLRPHVPAPSLDVQSAFIPSTPVVAATHNQLEMLSPVKTSVPETPVASATPLHQDASTPAERSTLDSSTFGDSEPGDAARNSRLERMRSLREKRKQNETQEIESALKLLDDLMAE